MKSYLSLNSHLRKGAQAAKSYDCLVYYHFGVSCHSYFSVLLT